MCQIKLDETQNEPEGTFRTPLERAITDLLLIQEVLDDVMEKLYEEQTKNDNKNI